MPTTEMTIRPYLPSDESAVIKLWRQCDLLRPWNNPKRDIERKLQVNPELFLVGLIDNKVIATVIGGYDGHRGWIYYMAVAPSHRRRGLGGQIMEAVESKMLELGCPKINIQVRAENSGVLEFYEGIGYKREERVSLAKRLAED